MIEKINDKSPVTLEAKKQMETRQCHTRVKGTIQRRRHLTAFAASRGQLKHFQ